MASSWKIAAFSACIAGVSLLSVGWWVHRKATERKSLEEASASRTRAEQGDPKAEFDLGTRYYYGRGVPQDYPEAARWYRKAADQGNAKAQFYLGSMYRDGKGVSQDYSEALRWCRKAAEQGDPKGQAALGYAYYSGGGVPQDYAEAARWYRKAAEQDYALAQQGLAYMYANAKGVQQDDTQAVAWYRKSAEQGDAVAQQSLGYMYASGRGVPLDRMEAVRWYRKAAEQGDPNARRALESLGSGSKPPTKTRYIEISLALMGFIAGLSCLCLSFEFLLPGRKLRDWRQPVITLLGVVFLANAGLSLYASAHDVRYCPYHYTFHLARTILVATAILIIVTVVLPAKKKSNALPG